MSNHGNFFEMLSPNSTAEPGHIIGVNESLSLGDPGGNLSNETFACHYEPHNWLEAKLVLISIFGTIVACFGIFGNLTTALILTRPSMRSPNNLYLTALAVFDTCLLITAILIYSVEYIIEYTNNFQLYVAWLTYLRFCYALSHISQTGSVYTTVAVTMERYIAVVHPHRSKLFCTKRGASVSVLAVTCFAILFNCTKFFELEIERVPGCTEFSAYKLAAGPLMASTEYQVIYSLWLSNIVMVFLPFCTLLLFNSFIAWTIRRSLQRLSWAKRGMGEKHSELKEKSKDATRVLVIIVLIFLICNFWGFVTTLLERIYGVGYLITHVPKFYAFSREAINFLAIINSSINFVIYCIFGKDFRKELIIVYGCRSGFTLVLPMDDKFAPWRSLRLRRSKNNIYRKRPLERPKSAPISTNLNGADDTTHGCDTQETTSHVTHPPTYSSLLRYSNSNSSLDHKVQFAPDSIPIANNFHEQRHDEREVNCEEENRLLNKQRKVNAQVYGKKSPKGEKRRFFKLRKQSGKKKENKESPKKMAVNGDADVVRWNVMEKTPVIGCTNLTLAQTALTETIIAAPSLPPSQIPRKSFSEIHNDDEEPFRVFPQTILESHPIREDPGENPPLVSRVPPPCNCPITASQFSDQDFLSIDATPTGEDEANSFVSDDDPDIVIWL